MKQTISASPAKSTPPYSHLEPLLDGLLQNGNPLATLSRWFEDRDSWHAKLAKPIDMQLLRNNFDIPKSILLTGEHDTILCQNTWITIEGAGASKPWESKKFTFEE